jgi:hypothetical protein
MSDKGGLSPLSLVYLEHLQDITAGYNSLRADIPSVLAAVGQRAIQSGQSDIKIGDNRIKRTWKVIDGFEFTLRLHWKAHSGWPSFAICESGGDIKKELRHVFTPTLLSECSVAVFKEEALRQNATEACWQAWQESVESAEQFLGDDRLQARVRGVEFMRSIATTLTPMLRARSFPNTKIATANTTKGGAKYPCHVQWVQTDSKKKSVYWDITFHPDPPAASGAAGPFLYLVVYDGKYIDEALEKVGKAGRYDSQPVLFDWSALLDDVLDDSSRADSHAAKIVEECVDAYEQVRSLMPPVD